MPIYEYTCKSCDSRFEQLMRSMSGDASVQCPECGSKKTHRVLSVFAVGADGGARTAAAEDTLPPGMCGRCGGPGPCAMD